MWGDRLTSAETRALFLQHMNEVSQARFKLSVDKYLYSTALGTPDYNFLPKIYFSHLGAAKNDPAVFDEVRNESRDRSSGPAQSGNGYRRSRRSTSWCC